jgi:phytoene synthase
MEFTVLERSNDTAADDVVRDAARQGAPDRYLAALLAPRGVRGDLVTLAAFAAEIEKIPQQISDPHIGEIRLQWWRDMLLTPAGAAKSGHPVADAMADAIQRHALPLGTFSDCLDATVHSLYADAPANDEQLALELGMKEGALFTLAAYILGVRDFDTTRGIGYDAAQAYGLSRLGLTLPYALARWRNPLPPSFFPVENPADWRAALLGLSIRARAHLEHVRSAYAAEPAAVKIALLPVALVEPYLQALTQPTHDPARDIAEIAPLTRAWRLATTRVHGRI